MSEKLMPCIRTVCDLCKHGIPETESCYKGGHYKCYKNGVYTLFEERRAEQTGQWIISSDGYYPYCSKCYSEPKNGKMTNYCPNCGAKMDGKDGAE